MRFTDTVMIFVVIFSLYFSVLAEMKNFFKIENLLLDEKRIYMERKFIDSSFRNICKGKAGFENFNEWQSVCRVMFGLEYIGWSNASDFMKVSYDKSLNQLMCGVWTHGDEECQIFCRLENLNEEN
ncbi:MAG: hypothetical protein SOT46_08715 [Treponema sp.]|nr:hypothetical protein [Spirochaetia bacterium]MDY2840432.1 hypothetical protein [Treponema sp.]